MTHVLAIKQLQDPEIVKIRDKLQKSVDNHFEVRDGVVYRKVGCKLMFYVPKSMPSNIIRLCHDEYGHVGVNEVFKIMSRNYGFQNLRNEVNNYIDNCLKCNIYSSMAGKIEGLQLPIPNGNVPFMLITMDP